MARAEKVMLTASTDTVGYLVLDGEGTWHTNTQQGGPRKWSEDLGCNLGLIQMGVKVFDAGRWFTQCGQD